MSSPMNESPHILPVSQSIIPEGGIAFNYEYDPTSQDSDTDEGLKLEFREEPCGLTVEHGFGFIQVEFGECIGPENRYVILRKLGFGMYSSVWLAKDTKDNRFVAIKVLTGYATFLVNEGMICELDVLGRISSQGKRMDETHCLSLHSHFTQPGKEPGDEKHLCLVMDVLGPSIDGLRAQDINIPAFHVKKILRDIVNGLNHLHSLGIVHTDIQPQNIMLDLGKGSCAFDIQSYLDTVPARRHPPERTFGNNKFTQVAVSQPFSITQYKDWKSQSFIIGDFGSAQFIGKQVNDNITAVDLRAPETLLGLPWNEKVDIWSFGCVAFELFSKQCLMQPFLTDFDWEPEKVVLFRMLSLTGERLPAEAVRTSKRGLYYLNPETGWLHDDTPSLSKSISDAVKEIQNSENTSVLAGFDVFLTKCLHIDPKDRISAQELLEDPWLNDDGQGQA